MKKIQKNGITPFRGIANLWPDFNFAAIFGHFHILKIDKSKSVSGYGLYKYIGEEKKVKKNGTSPQNTPSTKFCKYLIGYNSETTQPRVKILPPMDFVG